MNNKITKLSAISILSILMVGGMGTVHAQLTPEQELELDRLWMQYIDVYSDMQHLMENPPVKKSSSNITKMNNTLSQLESQIAVLESQMLPVQLAEIDPEIKAKMETTLDRLSESEFPWYHLSIDDLSGVLEIGIDQKSENINDQIIQFINDTTIPIYIYYGNSTFTFQSRNCDNPQERCDPIIGGSSGEDRYFGKDCTVSIPAQKQVGRNTVDGIVIPKHCMPNALDRDEQTFFQSDNAITSHLVGGIHTNPQSSRCDCVFIESETRNTSDNIIYRGDGRTDFPTSGKVNLATGDRIFIFGSESGIRNSVVSDTNVRKQIDGRSYHGLVEMPFLGYTDGDSGAPVLKRTSGFPYGAMNIAQAYEMGNSGPLKNYVHSWSYMQSQLGLR